MLAAMLQDIMGADANLLPSMSIEWNDLGALLAPGGADDVVLDFEPVDAGQAPRLDQRNPVTCPKCGHAWRVGADGKPVAADD
jgi:hypothetical protein